LGKLSGKTCVVTAGAQGIGRAIAEAFKREDGDVIAVDLQQQVLQSWATPAGVRTFALDATDENAVERWAAGMGPVHVLVNCVGTVAVGTVLEGTTQDLERSFRINVVTMASMIRAFLPGMRAPRRLDHQYRFGRFLGESRAGAVHLRYHQGGGHRTDKIGRS
jgi:2-keto-3-deoxy-L-fuconate dehydrogenase